MTIALTPPGYRHIRIPNLQIRQHPLMDLNTRVVVSISIPHLNNLPLFLQRTTSI